jgi:hypothetical protein
MSAPGAKLPYEVDPPKGSSRRKAAVAEISLWNPGGRTLGMDWSRSTVTSSVLGLASVGQKPLLAHVVVERRQSALSRHPNSSAKR